MRHRGRRRYHVNRARASPSHRVRQRPAEHHAKRRDQYICLFQKTSTPSFPKLACTSSQPCRPPSFNKFSIFLICSEATISTLQLPSREQNKIISLKASAGWMVTLYSKK